MNKASVICRLHEITDHYPIGTTVFGIGSELVRYRYGTGTVGLGNR
jgi:hypothetical protein